METNTTATFLPTYAAACDWMRKNPGCEATWDAGNGWTSFGRYDARLRRFVMRGEGPKGGSC